MEDKKLNLSLDLYKEIRNLIPDMTINFTKNHNLLIPYDESTAEQRQIIWDTFDKEDTPYFVTDDAGPNYDSLGIIVYDDEDMMNENWEMDVKFPRPGTKIIFLTPNGDLSGIVKDVIDTHTLIVKDETGEDVIVKALLDGGWILKEEHEAKTVSEILREWGGAGFSYGGSSIFPVNRGGQMNRGGFGGALNLGGPNMMYTYEIKPLNRLLQPKPTDAENTESIHNGHVIEGEELNKKDGKLYRGTVIHTAYSDNKDIKYYVILHDETSTKKMIDPTTAVLLSGENYFDDENYEPGPDEADLERAGLMDESVRARFINESLVNKKTLKWLEKTLEKYNKVDDIELITTIFLTANQRNWNKNDVYKVLTKYNINDRRLIQELFSRFDELKKLFK